MRRECDQNERKCIPLGSAVEELATPGSRATHPKAHGLIVNADDWGLNHETTDRTLDCARCGAISSVSAMVFMDDSERASSIARENVLDVGLHLNFTTPFSAPNVSSRLLQAQQRLTNFLRSNRLAQVFFHPGLTGIFRCVVLAQIEEYRRLYGAEPTRIDGHHHMHLCANVLLGGLLPPGTVVRRNFSFQPGEKSGLNRMYRKLQDRMIEKRHPVTNYFFSIQPIEKKGRLRKIVKLADTSLVELETHPVNIEEFRFLTGGEFIRSIGTVKVALRYEVGGR